MTEKLTVSITGGNAASTSHPRYNKTYTGRCLGLISNRELAFLIEDPGLAAKVFTAESVTIKDIAKINWSKTTKKRLVLALGGGDNELTTDKTIFVSPEIDYISYEFSRKNRLGIVCQDAYMHINA